MSAPWVRTAASPVRWMMLLGILSPSAAIITLKVYWETLCPTSQQWMLEKYKPLWNKPEFRKLFKVEHYAYGNARTNVMGSITCQHGTKECDANKMQTCAQKKLTKDEATNFLFCSVEKLQQMATVDASVIGCISDKLVASSIITCYKGEEGAKLQASVAKATVSHTYVPWVTTADGKQLKIAENNLEKFICSTMPASDKKPTECNFNVLVRSENRTQPEAEACANPYPAGGDRYAGTVENFTVKGEHHASFLLGTKEHGAVPSDDEDPHEIMAVEVDDEHDEGEDNDDEPLDSAETDAAVDLDEDSSAESSSEEGGGDDDDAEQ